MGKRPAYKNDLGGDELRLFLPLAFLQWSTYIGAF